jgi:hypothetical protein
LPHTVEWALRRLTEIAADLHEEVPGLLAQLAFICPYLAFISPFTLPIAWPYDIDDRVR